MKKLLKLLFSRAAYVAVFMLLQIISILLVLSYFHGQFAFFYSVCLIIAAVMVVNIVIGNGNPAYKIAWIIPILALPMFGIMLYFVFGTNRLTTAQHRRMDAQRRHYAQAVDDIRSYGSELEKLDPTAATESAYLERIAPAPLCRSVGTEYYPLGDVMYPKMLEALEKAERYIFLEYFIVEPGVMWDPIQEILERKAAQGVDVRLIYDDVGSILTVPASFNRSMEERGIKCRPFHRLRPVLTGSFNHRDHRKICVVDGKEAFTGGINLADEYINAKERFGHWLDCGMKVRGDAAYSFTVMFLSMWDYITDGDSDYGAFRPAEPEVKPEADDGYVQPFMDSPVDGEPVGETAYINMIYRAKKYLYICTPYLIIDNEMITALITAAKSGVDVRIITPGVPDKYLVHETTRSYYDCLVSAGVRVYEYIPGFIHSKTMVCDGERAICGTINLDYRSLYLHYECAVWMYGCSCIADMKEAFLAILPKCGEITQRMCEHKSLPARLTQSLLRLFSPMM